MKTMKFLFFFCLAVIGLIACTDEVSQPLVPEFSSDSKEIVVGENVTFKDESLGDPSKWNWYFEGGEPSSSILFSPTVTYNIPGTYSVRLMVGRGVDSITLEKEAYITVNHPSEISVDFSVNQTVATNEDIITFEDLTIGYPTKWLWEFTSQEGNVITNTEQNPSLRFVPGIYSVKLTATNPNTSSSKTVVDYLTIIDKHSVAADFSAFLTNTYAGGSIQFEDKTSGNATEWLWTFEGGTPYSSTEKNPVVSYTTPGKYKVTLKSSNEVNASTTEKEDFIIVIPSEDLVFYFPFDGSSEDAGPNKLNPEILTKGDAEIKFNAQSRYANKDGEGRSAAQFTSKDANNYAILSLPESDHLDFGSSDFTVAFWAKVPPITRNSAIYHHGAAPGTPNATKQSWFRFQPSGKYVVFCVEYKGLSGNWVEYQEKSMTDNEWHHFVCIYKEKDGKKNGYMYIDGKLVLSNVGKDIKAIEKSPYYIGCNYRFTSGKFSPENFLNGFLDDYILYNRALTDKEAKDLYTFY